jgi:hypothetical protein
MTTYSWSLIEQPLRVTDTTQQGATLARDLQLDTDGDLELEAGDLVLIRGAEAIIQAVNIALQFVKGEWFYDLEAGVPYFQDVLVKNPSPDLLQSTFRKAVLEVKGIESVTSLSLTLDRSTRTLSVGWSAVSDVGLLSSQAEV